MPSGQESLGQQSAIQSALDSGIESLSQKQQVIFQRYKRLALVSDGSVFLVATGDTLISTGSLHYASDLMQDETETISHNEMIFTSESEIAKLNAIAPDALWIGSWPIADAPPLRVAFSQRGNFYPQSNIWHFSGLAVLPIFSAQIIENPADIPAGPIVSNSLPIWLAQNALAGRIVPVYPSFLIPSNIVPPYIVAHITPEMTDTLAAAPIIGPWPGVIEPNTGASPLHGLAASQLMRDEVTLTLYGFSNQDAWQWLAALYEASANGTAPFGFANSPAIQDDKRPQREIAALAQMKTIRISANYLQGAANAVARRLILSAMVGSIQIIGGIVPEGGGGAIQRSQTVASVGSIFE